MTSDGRYLVVRGRLWRLSNPELPADVRQALVKELMTARRTIATAKKADDEVGEQAARDIVDRVKRDLGERGDVWWKDGAPDYNRHMAKNTPYVTWFATMT